MKQILTVVATLLLVASITHAESNTTVITRMYGGAAVPTAPDVFKDNWKTGYTGGAGFGIMKPDVGGYELELYVSFDYALFGKKSFVAAAEDLKTVMVFGNAKMNFMPEGAVNPYIIAGLGYFHAKGKRPESENALGMHGSAGLQLPIMEEVEIFAEGDYVYGATDGDGIQFFIGKVGLSFIF